MAYKNGKMQPCAASERAAYLVTNRRERERRRRYDNWRKRTQEEYPGILRLFDIGAPPEYIARTYGLKEALAADWAEVHAHNKAIIEVIDNLKCAAGRKPLPSDHEAWLGRHTEAQEATRNVLDADENLKKAQIASRNATMKAYNQRTKADQREKLLARRARRQKEAEMALLNELLAVSEPGPPILTPIFVGDDTFAELLARAEWVPTPVGVVQAG